MTLYSDLIQASVANINKANEMTGESLTAARFLVEIAQVHATLAVAEAIRNK